MEVENSSLVSNKDLRAVQSFFRLTKTSRKLYEGQKTKKQKRHKDKKTKTKQKQDKKAITYKAETARINLSKNKHTATKGSVNYHLPVSLKHSRECAWCRRRQLIGTNFCLICYGTLPAVVSLHGRVATSLRNWPV